MQTILTAVHMIIGVLLIIVILLQNGSDGLNGLGSSVTDNVMSPTTSANFMTKFTAILAALFIINCLMVANISSKASRVSIADKISETQKATSTKAEKKKETKSLPIAK